MKQEAKRINYLDAGRRWRKTTFCMSLCVDTALEKKIALWIAPTYDQSFVAWDETKRGCGLVADFNQSRMMAFFPGGGRIIFRSGDKPDSVRGHTAHRAVLDEAADQEERVFTEIVLPMLMDTRGDGWIIGTPKGMNWFAADPAAAQESPEDTIAWQIPSYGCEVRYDEVTGDAYLVRKPHPYENPHLPWDLIQKDFHRMTERKFRQEILAEFIEDAGAVFQGVARVATLPCRPVPYLVGHRYQLGIDIGRVHDYTVLIVMDLTTGEMAHFQRFNQTSWERIYNAIATTARSYPGCRVFVDATGLGDHVPSEIRRRGVSVVPVKFTNHSKREMADHLAALIEHRRIKLWNHDTLKFELQAYQYLHKEGAQEIKMGAPSGKHDDIPTALMLANNGYQPALLDVPGDYYNRHVLTNPSELATIQPGTIGAW